MAALGLLLKVKQINPIQVHEKEFITLLRSAYLRLSHYSLA